jgi:hypothetical protein
MREEMNYIVITNEMVNEFKNNTGLSDDDINNVIKESVSLIGAEVENESDIFFNSLSEENFDNMYYNSVRLNNYVRTVLSYYNERKLKDSE